MSWDVVLMKTKINLDDKDANPGNLGNKNEIIERLTTLLPTLDYSNTSWGIFTDKDFSIEFNTGTDDIVETIMLHIRGGGDPLVIIKIICDSENWFALDCSTMEYINTDILSKESWENFQKFRDKIIDGN
jgi:hypothetical protein